MTTTALYETDIHAWSQRQVELLRAEEFAEVDWLHVIEEIESLGTSQRSELRNRLIILIMHLLNGNINQSYNHAVGRRQSRYSAMIWKFC